MDSCELDKAQKSFSSPKEIDCQSYESRYENEKSYLPINKTDSLSGLVYD